MPPMVGLRRRGEAGGHGVGGRHPAAQADRIGVGQERGMHGLVVACETPAPKRAQKNMKMFTARPEASTIRPKKKVATPTIGARRSRSANQPIGTMPSTMNPAGDPGHEHDDPGAHMERRLDVGRQDGEALTLEVVEGRDDQKDDKGRVHRRRSDPVTQRDMGLCPFPEGDPQGCPCHPPLVRLISGFHLLRRHLPPVCSQYDRPLPGCLPARSSSLTTSNMTAYCLRRAAPASALRTGTAAITDDRHRERPVTIGQLRPAPAATT